jgi:hypothetical protein
MPVARFNLLGRTFSLDDVARLIAMEAETLEPA